MSELGAVARDPFCKVGLAEVLDLVLVPTTWADAGIAATGVPRAVVKPATVISLRTEGPEGRCFACLAR